MTNRPLVLAGPAAVAGAAVAQAPLDLQWTAWLLVVFPAALVLSRRHAAGLLVAAALLAGRMAAEVHSVAPATRVPPRLGTCRLEVAACGEDPFRRRAWCSGAGRDGQRVHCSWPGELPAGLGPGARVRAAGRLYRPREPGNPGERNYPGASIRADLRSAANLQIVRPAPAGPRRWLTSVRRRAGRRLARTLPKDVAPIAAALLLGIRSGVPDKDRGLFERTGTLHLLAISGLHVLLLAGMVHSLLRRLGVGARTAATVTLLLAWAYVPIAGSGAPIRRAVTVLTIYGLALVRGKPPDAASALGGAALLLALTEPVQTQRVGFYLSFAATAGILWLAGGWQHAWGRRHRLLARFPAVRHDQPIRLHLRGYVLRALPVSLAAWCATQAICAVAFGIVTPAGPVINIIVGPLLAMLLPLVGLYAAGLDFLALPVIWCVRSMRLILELCDGACDPVYFAAIPAGAPVLWVCGCVLLRRRARCGLGLLFFGWIAAHCTRHPESASMTVFDVGHGQAVLIRFEDGAAVLVDAGSRGRLGVGRRALLPALRAAGVTRFVAVVCTHRDADHWNALPALLRRIPARRILVGSSAPPAHVLRSVRVAHPEDGTVIHATKFTTLTVLASGKKGSDNDRSLVLALESHGRRVLLPADREEAGLGSLLERLDPCDIVIAPHHGARCGAARAVGRATHPAWLLVSTARGFAHAATLADYGGRVLETHRHGCITVRFAPFSVRTFRPRRPERKG